jgi:sorting nexin-13
MRIFVNEFSDLDVSRHPLVAFTLKIINFYYFLVTDSKLTRNDSKKFKVNRALSGNPDIDSVIHRILDYIFRDFIESWYNQVSENKDFKTETRTLTEECLINFIKRLKQAPLMHTITTKMIDDVAAHAKAYHDAMRMVQESQKGPKSLTKFNSSFHRRNKSESALLSEATWNIAGANVHKKIANSTFYSIQTDESLLDPEKQLIETFFDITGNKYKKEVNDDKACEKYFIAITETIAYYTMEPESFDCDPLRAFITSILGSLVSKATKLMADADFINLQIAKHFMNNPPLSEWLIKTIRQSNDLSELRALRHLITREMDLKHRDKNYAGEVSSLKYTQKLIDLRITSVQNSKDKKFIDRDATTSSKIPRLSLDEILCKDIALSYWLDYLQIMNLQKYVIFYCLAIDWKNIARERLESCEDEIHRQQIMKNLRDRAFELFKEYLLQSSSNYLNIDQGLIEVLHIKIKDTFLMPSLDWFESICKFVYEKLKNEHVFLQNFYESPAYKKLIAELEDNEIDGPDMKSTSSQAESGSDSNSGDFILDDDGDELEPCDDDDSIEGELLNVTRHQRSHSDTGVILCQNINSCEEPNELPLKKLQAKIINTAINSSGNFAVYAIHVIVIDEDELEVKHQKSWHIYRRYSKFLELKKLLVRQFPYFKNVSLPFPKKQTFHNTNRDLLERRMVILNEFLQIVCNRSETDFYVMKIIREFLEPDNDDRTIHGTKVIKHLVNPIKSGMRTIKNVPDNVIGGISKLFMTKSADKFAYSDMIDAQNSVEYPALMSFVNLLNSVFDLEARSQWLKRGIQGIISAPFVGQSANKKIKEVVQKNILDPEVVHGVLCGLLNNMWPNGTRQDSLSREDTTKLRTRLAAKVAIFAFFTDDLKHILGSETTKIGLQNFIEMLQYPQLNQRLILVLLDRLLTAIFPTDNMTKHVIKA